MRNPNDPRFPVFEHPAPSNTEVHGALGLFIGANLKLMTLNLLLDLLNGFVNVYTVYDAYICIQYIHTSMTLSHEAWQSKNITLV